MSSIVRLLQNGIHRINAEYRRGPSLYFYRRVCALRAERPSVERFLADNYCVEMVYATLVAWDMDSRRARMKDFFDFRVSLRNALPPPRRPVEHHADEDGGQRDHPADVGRPAQRAGSGLMET